MTIIHNLGFPRIGARRELKFALESYWRGQSDRAALEAVGAQLRRQHWAWQAGLDGVPVGDFSFYDQVLDMSFTLGNLPARVRGYAGDDLDNYFRVARGRSAPGTEPAGQDGQAVAPALGQDSTLAEGSVDKAACGCAPGTHDVEAGVAAGEMTKWFDSNYHYLVPEIDASTPIGYVDTAIADQVREAKEAGVEVRPVVVGPVSYLLMAKPSDEAAEGFHPLDRLGDVLHAYGHLLMDLHKAGATWVQLDEPALVSDSWNVDRGRILDFWRTELPMAFYESRRELRQVARAPQPPWRAGGVPSLAPLAWSGRQALREWRRCQVGVFAEASTHTNPRRA